MATMTPRSATPNAAPLLRRLDRSRQAAPQVFEGLHELNTTLTLPAGAPHSRIALVAEFGWRAR
jgi:hypothetical protein